MSNLPQLKKENIFIDSFLLVWGLTNPAIHSYVNLHLEKTSRVIDLNTFVQI